MKRSLHDRDPFKRCNLSKEQEMESRALIPIEQQTILFRNRPLVVVRLPDGRPGVVLRWICENLRIDPAHQSLVQYYVNQVHEATGKTHASIQSNLRLAFSVPSYKDIPESEWGKVVNWFRVQMERAHKKLHEQAPQPSLFDDPEKSPPDL